MPGWSMPVQGDEGNPQYTYLPEQLPLSVHHRSAPGLWGAGGSHAPTLLRPKGAQFRQDSLGYPLRSSSSWREQQVETQVQVEPGQTQQDMIFLISSSGDSFVIRSVCKYNFLKDLSSLPVPS